MSKLVAIFSVLVLLPACGSGQESESSPANFLEGGGWRIQSSPYILPPGSSIGVCDDRSNTGKADLVVDAVKIWLKAGGRDERIQVTKSCVADRVIKLTKLTEDVDFYGRAHPLTGNVHNVDVAKQWAGHWTANHEVGHVFGFGHIFNRTVSIMNSEENGRYMNGGKLSEYDYAEVKRMLKLPYFASVNKLWAQPRAESHDAAVLAPAAVTAAPAAVAPAPTIARPVEKASCLGVDRKTWYPHGRVTTYAGNTYTCTNGRWIFSAGIASADVRPAPAPAPVPTPVTKASCLGADRQTSYPHAQVTTYAGNTYTCNDGRWIFSAGIR